MDIKPPNIVVDDFIELIFFEYIRIIIEKVSKLKF